MKLQRLQIKNFRGLEDISLETDKFVNVIVGPNAVGKSTILEAIRLCRALLSPRYLEENTQALISLGAMSQHFRSFGNHSLDFSVIARDSSKPIGVKAAFQLTDSEIQFLNMNSDQLGLSLLRASIGREDANNQFFLTQFLSSPNGQIAFQEMKKSAEQTLSELGAKKSITLDLTIDNRSSIMGTNPANHAMIALLDQRLPPHRTMFSYFPADRAFPAGEVQIQIGSGEAANQLQSHIGQPVTKYLRLKNTILNGMLIHADAEREIKTTFNEILSALLPGKSLDSLFVNEIGLFKVLIKDDKSGRVFDIDSMSSGEKGLILTFVLIKQTMNEGGIVLLDEPELHLNPAVCRGIVPFFVENLIKTSDVQVFICTHSSDLLGTAFEREDCNLYHLRSSTDLTPVFRKDHSEMYEALRRLGSSTADVLFTRGAIYVEGEHDADLLMEGFFEIVAGYKITPLGGRGSVEKEISSLQTSEKLGALDKLQIFIFDNDNKSSKLKSSEFVKVIQWDRYCLENYLIDEKILFDLVSDHARTPPTSRGEFNRRLRDLALSQLTLSVIRETYATHEPENPGIRPDELRRSSLDAAISSISDRLQRISSSLANFDAENWRRTFTEECVKLRDAKHEDWEQHMFKRCNGKLLISDLYAEYTIKISHIEFKKKIIQRMKSERTEEWKLVETTIRNELGMK